MFTRYGEWDGVFVFQFGQLAIATVDGLTFRIALLCAHTETGKPPAMPDRERVARYRAKRKAIASAIASGT